MRILFKYGEVFIEERNGTWNTPYLFNGKFINALTPQTIPFPISPQRNHHALKGQTPSAVGTALGNAPTQQNSPQRANSINS